MNMRRVEHKAEFDRILTDARMCVYIDSRRAPTPLHLMVFDDGMLCADYFFAALRDLIEQSADPGAYFLVLEPDPVDNFHRLYGRYPVVEIGREDSSEAYLGAMNEDVGDGQGFSLGNLCLTWVIVPPSNKWFIHAIRSAYDDSGHLWVPPEWVDKLLAAHPGVFRDVPASLREGRADTSGETCPAVPWSRSLAAPNRR